MRASDILCFTLVAIRGHSIDVESAVGNAKLPADVVHLGAGLMLLDCLNDLFFAVASLHSAIS